MDTEGDHLRAVREDLRLLIRDTEFLASLPGQGPTYDRWRKTMKRIEWACDNVVYHRLDGRWSMISVILGQVHQQCGDWIRGFHPRAKFLMLADMLRQLERHIDDLQHKATGKLGAIYQTPQRAPDRTEGRPVQALLPEHVTASGIIVPAEIAA